MPGQLPYRARVTFISCPCRALQTFVSFQCCARLRLSCVPLPFRARATSMSCPCRALDTSVSCSWLSSCRSHAVPHAPLKPCRVVPCPTYTVPVLGLFVPCSCHAGKTHLTPLSPVNQKSVLWQTLITNSSPHQSKRSASKSSILVN